MGEEKKRNLFDKLKDVVDQAIVSSGGAAEAAKKRMRPTNPLASKISLATDTLSKARATAQLAGQVKRTDVLPRNHPGDEQLSPRRLAMIDDYMRGEAKIEQMKDPAYMYKIVSDERAYQTRLLMDYRRQLSQLGRSAEGPEVDALQAKIKRAQAIVQNLFKVLKRITGKQGRTGGTDFLSDNK